MTRSGRLLSEGTAAWRTFLRRRTAVFFTFLFPVILVVIFGALVRTTPTGGGLFTEPAVYYVPGYLAVVVLFTPLSRVASTVARSRDGNRFEKLATTPLTRWEWLLAHASVNAVVVSLASVLVVGLTLVLTGARVTVGPHLLALVPAILLGAVLFSGLGAVLGALADSQDGAVAASNAVGLPLLFLSETFVPPDMLPAWFRPLVGLSPLTYVARVARAAVTAGAPGELGGSLLVVLVLAAGAIVLGARLLPRTE